MLIRIYFWYVFCPILCSFRILVTSPVSSFFPPNFQLNHFLHHSTISVRTWCSWYLLFFFLFFWIFSHFGIDFSLKIYFTILFAFCFRIYITSLHSITHITHKQAIFSFFRNICSILFWKTSMVDSLFAYLVIFYCAKIQGMHYFWQVAQFFLSFCCFILFIMASYLQFFISCSQLYSTFTFKTVLIPPDVTQMKLFR